jgi:hypothetical protein
VLYARRSPDAPPRRAAQREGRVTVKAQYISCYLSSTDVPRLTEQTIPVYDRVRRHWLRLAELRARLLDPDYIQRQLYSLNHAMPDADGHGHAVADGVGRRVRVGHAVGHAVGEPERLGERLGDGACDGAFVGLRVGRGEFKGICVGWSVGCPVGCAVSCAYVDGPDPVSLLYVCVVNHAGNVPVM